MSATRSWARSHLPELLWVGCAAPNVAITVRVVDYETVPFHFVWVSLTLIYGWRVWRLRTTLAVLVAVCVATGLSLGWVVIRGPQGPDELTEVPLMGAMFLAMVWHAERRRSALRDVERAAAREREFVRAASHQLKTPIAVARGLASLVRDHAGEAAPAPDLDDLLGELDRLSRLTEDLTLLAAAEQQDNLVCAEVDFEDLLVEAAARRWSRIEDRRWRVETCEGALTHADRDRLDASLDALLENAVRATHVGDGISVVGRAERNVAVIEISDTGVGIPEDVLPYVFQRFWSRPYGDSARRGTGLGLAIVKAIVDAHGGEVAIASTLGRGTTVTIRLPGYRPAAPPAEPAGALAADGREPA